MKIVYMGTPDFAVPALEALCRSEHTVSLVVTQPDKAKDRGKKVQFTPVKKKALEYGVPVVQPEKVKNNPEFLEQLKNANSDLIVVAAYGRILPVSVLELPPLGCVNLHASLLPKYRGAAPIHRAVINGEQETGVTLMYMAEGMDTGDMIAKSLTPVEQKTTEQLHEELAQMGASLLMEYLPALASGTNDRIAQNEEDASYAPMVFKHEGVLDYSKTPKEIACLVRGMNSWPGASTKYLGQTVKIWEAQPINGEKTTAANGKILSVEKQGITVACAGGKLLLTKIQFPGKKAMTVDEYIRGNAIEVDVILG